jgi:hypothetical protein
MGRQEVSSEFVVEPLAADMLRVAFPLVRHTLPSLTLEAWLRYARRFVRPGHDPHCGILAVRRAGRPFPCGLVCYQEKRDLLDGPVLLAEHLVSMDLLDCAGVVRALSKRLDELARQTDCQAVHSILLGQPGAVAANLLGSGHRSGGIIMRKSVATGPE